MATIDDYVDLANQFTTAFRSTHPVLYSITKKLYAGTRWEFEIANARVETYTLILDGDMSFSYEAGSHEAVWHFKTSQAAFDEMVGVMRDPASGFITGNPVRWCLTYLPREIRNFLKGDFIFGRK